MFTDFLLYFFQLQQTRKLHGGGSTVGGVTDPDVTAHTPRHHQNSKTKGGNHKRSSSNAAEMTSVFTLHNHHDNHHDHHDTATSAAHNNNANTTSSSSYSYSSSSAAAAATTAAVDAAAVNPFDVSNDTEVSFYYSIEGDRSRRVSYRPLSADCTRLSHLVHPSLRHRGGVGEVGEGEGEGSGGLQEAVAVCREILDCMRAGKKHGGGGGCGADAAHEKASSKAARREWELMAILLDRIFLIVFFLLTLGMSAYVYGSIV